MRIRGKIIPLLFLISCTSNDVVNAPVDNSVDSLLRESSKTTNNFQFVIYDANKFESQMWSNVSNKMDSLVERTQELEQKLDKRPKIVRSDGSVKILTPIEEIKAYQDSTGRNKMR